MRMVCGEELASPKKRILLRGSCATSVTGGEVEDFISGCLPHDPFKGRRAGLFGCFSRSQLIH